MLTPDEKARLRTFQWRVRDLEACSLVGTNVTRLTVHLAGPKQGLVGFDPDHFKAFAITLRQFFLVGDVQVERVCGIIENRCPVPRLVDWSRRYRQDWDEVLRTPMGIAVDCGTGPKNYTFDEFFKLWLYGGMFHSDADKEETLKSMPGLAPEVLMMLTQRRLPGILELLRMIAEVIRIWLDDPDAPVPEPPRTQ